MLSSRLREASTIFDLIMAERKPKTVLFLSLEMLSETSLSILYRFSICKSEVILSVIAESQSLVRTVRELVHSCSSRDTSTRENRHLKTG